MEPGLQQQVRLPVDGGWVDGGALETERFWDYRFRLAQHKSMQIDLLWEINRARSTRKRCSAVVDNRHRLGSGGAACLVDHCVI
jgi:hypothetical protein